MKTPEIVIAKGKAWQNCARGVMLRHSKHEGKGLYASILREPQDNNALWMKIIIMASFCLTISVTNALSQVNDTLKKHTGTAAHVKPLIVVDGIIYSGDLKDINPDDISNVAVLKNPGATNIYGPQGANGVIIIQTKHYKLPTYKPKPLDSTVEKDALFVIDGVPSNNKLNDVDPKNVLSINILKKGKNSNLSFEPVRDIVIVVTKTGAIKAYQKKLSTFSIKYKDYLDKRNGDDSSLLYVLDGVPLQGKRDDIIASLYNIPTESIKNIGFNQGEMEREHGTALVIINLKDIVINLK